MSINSDYNNLRDECAAFIDDGLHYFITELSNTNGLPQSVLNMLTETDNNNIVPEQPKKDRPAP